jgi:hypothetical protein
MTQSGPLAAKGAWDPCPRCEREMCEAKPNTSTQKGPRCDYHLGMPKVCAVPAVECLKSNLCWLIPVLPALGRLRQEGQEFQASFDYE